MELTRLSIGAMAELNRVTEQTLRLYDRIDLLKPKYTNSQTGYRYYTIGQSTVLDIIQYYKHMGFSLEEIKQELSSSMDSPIQLKLEKRYAEIDAEINQLKMCQKSIQRTLNNHKKYVSLPKTGEFFLEYVPERKIIVYNADYNILESDYNNYEYTLRRLKNYLLSIEFPMMYFCNAGTIIRNRDFKESRLYSNEIYLLIDYSIEKYAAHAKTEVVPQGTYLSMCCTDFYNEKKYAELLIEEIKRKRYKFEGDYICEVISEFPDSEEQHRQFFYKIQIRIG